MTVIDNDGVLAALFERHPDAIVVYDLEGILIDANPAAVELAGFAVEELRGRHVASQVYKGDAQRVAVAARNARLGETDHLETTIRRKDGVIVPVEVFIFAVPGAAGKPQCVFALARDLRALRSAELSLGKNQERFRSLFEFHPDGILSLKADGTISRVNLALERATGLFNEKLTGRPWTDVIAPESHAIARDTFTQSMRGESNERDCLFLDRLGNRIDMQIKLVPLLVGSQVEGAYVIAKNITAQRAAERAMIEQTERIRELYLISVSDDDTETQIRRTLELGCDALGFDFGYVTQMDGDELRILSVVGPPHTIQPGMVFPRSAVISNELAVTRDTVDIPDLDTPDYKEKIKRLGHPWRTYFAHLLRVHNKPFGSIVFAGRTPRRSGMASADRDLAHLMSVFVGAAIERAEHERRVEQLAFHDALTGLPNRVLFDDRIRQALVTARRYDHGFGVMYLDLDKFKLVNDQLGHPAGDLLLRLVADRLRTILRESDTVARFGGDEFVILQPTVNGFTDSSDLARKIVTGMQQPFDLSGSPRTIHTSIGISMFPHDGSAIEELMNKADQALYRAKRTGRNRWVFFNEEQQLREWPAGGSRAGDATA